MFKIEGKYTNCKVFANKNVVEYNAIEEVKRMMNNPITEGCEICLMPDMSYAGKNSVVGYIQTTKDKINPEIISGDIGCGITVYKINYNGDIDLRLLDEKIREVIHPDKRNNNHQIRKIESEVEPFVKYILKTIDMSERLFLEQLCTLGRGNHFIEILRDKDNYIYIAAHSGSRNLGQKILKYFTKNFNSKVFDDEKFKIELNNIKENIKDDSKFKLQSIVKELKNKHTYIHPNYIKGIKLREYKDFIEYACEYAITNRLLIIYTIRELISDIVNDNLEFIDKYESIHNYLGKDDIIRKGAISAYKDEKIVIGLNMAEGLILAKGKGNKEWLNSAPHGLGRMISRSESKKNLNMEDFTNDMKDVYSTSKSIEFIDESPLAYKNSKEVLENIEETCKIVEIIKPILNIKF